MTLPLILDVVVQSIKNQKSQIKNGFNDFALDFRCSCTVNQKSKITNKKWF